MAITDELLLFSQCLEVVFHICSVVWWSLQNTPNILLYSQISNTLNQSRDDLLVTELHHVIMIFIIRLLYIDDSATNVYLI